MDFVGFLMHNNCIVLYTWCLRYNICNAWFLDIRISTYHTVGVSTVLAMVMI